MHRTLRIFLILLALAALFFCARAFLTPPDAPDAPAAADPVPAPDPAPETGESDDPTPSVEPEPDPAPGTGDEIDGLPVDKLVITPERREYVDGSLTVFLPKLEVSRKIYGGTDAEQLRLGVGLFEYAQLPGEGNRNVSLAGHRNGRSNGVVNDHAPFYYIDTLGEGDYIYLYDSEHIYRYLYAFTEIIEADDWSYIKTTGDSVVTLTSCHPIGVSDQRIIVRGTLDEILPYDKDYAFPASKEVSEA